MSAPREPHLPKSDLWEADVRTLNTSELAQLLREMASESTATIRRATESREQTLALLAQLPCPAATPLTLVEADDEFIGPDPEFERSIAGVDAAINRINARLHRHNGGTALTLIHGGDDA